MWHVNTEFSGCNKWGEIETFTRKFSTHHTCMLVAIWIQDNSLHVFMSLNKLVKNAQLICTQLNDSCKSNHASAFEQHMLTQANVTSTLANTHPFRG